MAEPIRVLRVIARLNMGGPALHVAYLSAGLQERGYDTTLVAGALARGEGSMSFVADELGVAGRPRCRSLSREISPVADTLSIVRLVRLIQRERPHILHTHTAKAGAVGRIAGAARRQRAAADHRPHLPRPRAARLLRPAARRPSSACSSGGSPGDDAAHRGQPGGARRPRRARRRAGREVRRRPARDRARASASRSSEARERVPAPLRHPRRRGSSSAGSAG